MNSASSRLQAIVSLIRSGQFAKAVETANDVLRISPNHFDALHMKALASYYNKDSRSALTAIQKAVSIRNDFPEAYNSYGIILRSIGRLDEAIVQLKFALRLNPNYKEALYNIANCYQESSALNLAVRFYDAALRLDPRLVAALNNKGLILGKLEEHTAAVECFTRVIKQEPRFAEAYYNRGNAFSTLKKYDAALVDYNTALSLKPIFPSALCNRANVLRAVGRLDDARNDYDASISQDARFVEARVSRAALLSELGQHVTALDDLKIALELSPQYADAYNNRGNILKELQRLDEALKDYDEAIRLKPGYAEAYCNRGNTLKEMKRPVEAVFSYDVAISLKSDFAEAYCNRGTVFKQLQKYDEALASYNEALKLKPDYSEAQFNKGLILLSRAEYAAGFALYKARWDTNEHKHDSIVTDIARWDGNTKIQDLLIWGEQGIGDEIFYASLISLLPRAEMRVSIAADKRLHPIYERSFSGVQLLDRELLKKPIYGGFDAQVPVGDLGHALSLDANTLEKRLYPYLHVNSRRKAQILEMNPFLKEKPVCGISWSSKNKKLSVEKSAKLIDFGPLITNPNISFVNLQYGDVDAEIREAKKHLSADIHQVDGLDIFNDIDGLLALIDSCSIIITTSNVTAHLAGAIGKAAIVLVPFGRGRIWYWHGQPSSVWYPSLRLVAQETPEDWSIPIQQAISIMEGDLRWKV